MGRLSRQGLCNLELAVVCDLNQEHDNLLADEAHEFLGERPKVYADIAEMVRENPDLRAADVTTDAGSHHVVATACVEAGLHVLCEKPLAITVRGCNRVIAAAQAKGVVLSVAEN